MEKGKGILLVEDNPDDAALTLRALEKNNISNKIVVARDGVEALDYLFGSGVHAGRATEVLPELMLLDLKLPKSMGSRCCGDCARTPEQSFFRWSF